jgi:copper transport protein
MPTSGTLARWGRLVAVVGFVSLIATANSEPVMAHAVLLRSIPSSNQTLAQAPDEVRLLFSEPVDIAFSSIRVVSSAGDSVDSGDAHVDQDDDHQLVVSLRPGLPNGIYSVAWRSLSTIDIHPDQGQYSLFVGVPVTVTEGVETEAPPITATAETTLGRWWFYLSASLFGGVLASWKFVLSGVLVGAHASSRAAVLRRAHRLIVFGGVLLLVGTLFTAVAQAAAAADVPLTSAVGQPLADLLLRGRFASIWWPRLGLEFISLLLIVSGGLEGVASDCALATLPAVLLTGSLTSHGAALPGAAGLAIATDWLHILGGTAWVGGLLGLLIGLPIVWGAGSTGEDAILPLLVSRFSRFALTASTVVVLSGVVQAILEVGSWSGLVETSYGQLVLVKIVLMSGMLLLATFNTRRGRHAYPQGTVQTAQLGLFRRGVRVELVLGVAVLVVAAVLTGTPPNWSSVSTNTTISQGIP